MLSPIFYAKNLQSHNTFGLDSFTSNYISIENAEDLCTVLPKIPKNSCVFILGGGSNVLLDETLSHYVLHMNNKGIHVTRENTEATWVKVAAGEIWHEFVLFSLAQGWFGLENLALIPGTVGAAPVQNIGAYGVEVASLIDEVHVVDLKDAKPYVLSSIDCAFAYRDSVFKRKRLIITAVTFKFPKRWVPQLQYPELADQLLNETISPSKVADAVIAIRQNKLPNPATTGNVGSFFKNPVISLQQLKTIQQQYPNIPYFSLAEGNYKIPAAWLIDTRGWKSRSHGGVTLHPKQALILINTGKASLKDVLEFSNRITQDTLTHFGIELEIEPVIVKAS